LTPACSPCIVGLPAITGDPAIQAGLVWMEVDGRMSRLPCVTAAVLTTMAALALGGIGTTTASASEVSFLLLTSLACSSGELIAFCWESNASENTLLELEGEEEFTISAPSGITLLETLGGEETFEITCEATDAYHMTNGVTELGGLILQHSPLQQDYSINARFLFSGCLLIGLLGAKCKIPTEKATMPLVANPRSATDIVFEPESGTVFIEIPFEQRSGCSVAFMRTSALTGTQLCTWEGSTTSPALTERLLECGKSGLRFFLGEEATLEFDAFIEPVHLNSRWDIVEVG